ELGPSFPADHRHSFLPVLEEYEENRRLMWFRRFIESFWILRLTPALMTSVSKDEAPRLDRDGANLPSWYRSIAGENPEAVDALNADMREIIDGLRFFQLASSGGTANKFFATVAKGSSNGRETYDLAFEELALSERQLFTLYAILHTAVRRASIVCF